MSKLSKKQLKQGVPKRVIVQRVGEPVHSPTCQGGEECELKFRGKRIRVSIRSHSNPMRGCHWVVPDKYEPLLGWGSPISRHDLWLRTEQRMKKKGERAREKQRRRG